MLLVYSFCPEPSCHPSDNLQCFVEAAVVLCVCFIVNIFMLVNIRVSEVFATCTQAQITTKAESSV